VLAERAGQAQLETTGLEPLHQNRKSLDSYRLFSSTTSRLQVSRTPSSSRSKTFSLRSSSANKRQNSHSNKFGEYTILSNLGLFRDEPPSLRYPLSPPSSPSPPLDLKRQPVFARRSLTGSRGRTLPRSPARRLPT